MSKLSLAVLTTLAVAAGVATTASAHKQMYWFPGSDTGIDVVHNIYEGFLFTDTHTRSRDFSKLSPSVPNGIADDYEYKLNVACDGVWQGWSPQYISAELGDNVHDFCPSSSQTATGGATYMGEK